jgi:hypothetical protein
VVGYRRRYDTRLLLAHMARLDAQAETEHASDDAARFDQLLACVGGVTPPAELATDGDGLPLPREDCADAAGEQAVEDLYDDDPEPHDEDDDGGAGEAAAGEDAAPWDPDKGVVIYRAAFAAAAGRWDGWTREAYDAVDRMVAPDFTDELADKGALDTFLAGTLSTASTSSGAPARPGSSV